MQQARDVKHIQASLSYVNNDWTLVRMFNNKKAGIYLTLNNYQHILICMCQHYSVNITRYKVLRLQTTLIDKSTGTPWLPVKEG